MTLTSNHLGQLLLGDFVLANDQKGQSSVSNLLGHTPITFMIVTYALTLVAALGAVTQLDNPDERLIMLYSIKQLLYGLAVLILVTVVSELIPIFRVLLNIFTGYHRFVESIIIVVFIFIFLSASILSISHFYCVSFWTIQELANASANSYSSLKFNIPYGESLNLNMSYENRCSTAMSVASDVATWAASILNDFGQFLYELIYHSSPNFFHYIALILFFMLRLAFWLLITCLLISIWYFIWDRSFNYGTFGSVVLFLVISVLIIGIIALIYWSWTYIMAMYWLI